MKEKDIFFALLRKALWGQPLVAPLAVEALPSLLKQADRQAVVALPFDAVCQSEVKLPTEIVLNYMSLLHQVERENKQLNTAVKALDGLFSQNGVDYRVVKGQMVAAIYPKPLLRQSGDVDFYCDAENFEKAKEIFRKKTNVKFEAVNSDYHLHFEHRGVVFEMHFALAVFYDKQRIRYWEQLMAEDKCGTVQIDGQDVKTLSPMLHVLYIFLHLYHHLMELGIGVRQFCDLAVMLKAQSATIDKQALNHHLHEFGMEKAYRACGSILVNYLGLPEQDFSYRITDKDRRYGEKILHVVFHRGNMGKYNKKFGFSGWRHNVEATFIKISHFVKFVPLAPSYSRSWIVHELRKKIAYKLGRRG